MQKKLKEMLELQDLLNTNTNDKNWRNGITPNGKIINWKRCIYMELCEAIDSLPWKHWKNIDWEIDYENFKIEMVDIWHFVMSYLLIFSDSETLSKELLWLTNQEVASILPKHFSKEDNLKLNDILEPYEELIRISLEKENTKEHSMKLAKQFFVCLKESDISIDDLYKLYIWKNVLNKFRQDNWYKDWTYKKIWNWKEDNKYLQEIIENTTWFDNIYNKLNNIYKSL